MRVLPDGEALASRTQDLAERLRLLHNKIRPQLARKHQDELLELYIGIGMIALDQKREATRCASSSADTEDS